MSTKDRTEIDGGDDSFDRLLNKLDDGFNASKERDGQLKQLLQSDLEAEKRLHESFKKRFDEADRKHNEQIATLKDILRHLSSTK